jgi:hypothetical protein
MSAVKSADAWQSDDVDVLRRLSTPLPADPRELVQGDEVPARRAEIPCYQLQGNRFRGLQIGSELPDLAADILADFGDFPVSSLQIRLSGSETSSPETGPTAI